MKYRFVKQTKIHSEFASEEWNTGNHDGTSAVSIVTAHSILCETGFFRRKNPSSARNNVQIGATSCHQILTVVAVRLHQVTPPGNSSFYQGTSCAPFRPYELFLLFIPSEYLTTELAKISEPVACGCFAIYSSSFLVIYASGRISLWMFCNVPLIFPRDICQWSKHAKYCQYSGDTARESRIRRARKCSSSPVDYEFRSVFFCTPVRCLSNNIRDRWYQTVVGMWNDLYIKSYEDHLQATCKGPKAWRAGHLWDTRTTLLATW